MSTEVKFSRIARVEEQYSLEDMGHGRLGGPSRRGYDIVRGRLGAATVYMTYGAGEVRDHNIVAVAPLAPDMLELRIERSGADKYVTAALTHLALLEYVKAWKDVKDQNGNGAKVISFIPLSDNPEADAPLHPLYGEMLGMEGLSRSTDQGEVIYMGDLAEVHGNATHALSRQSRPPLSIRPTPPMEAA